MVDKITHCVLMVSYNQEEYIKIALDSIFDNKLLPDKVIISDDCSTDNTWNIIMGFKEKYPNIIDAYRNEKNLGVNYNTNFVRQKGIDSNCDILSDCAGDDYLKPGLFEELNKVVRENQINVKKDKFIIITNTEELHPDGSVTLVNNFKLKDTKDLLYYRLRGMLSYREIGMSRNLVKDMPDLRTDLGLHADLLMTLDNEVSCEKIYFSSFISCGYRMGVGCVSKEKYHMLMESRLKVYEVAKNRYNFSDQSLKYIDYDSSFLILCLNYNLKNWFNCFIKFIINPKFCNYGRISTLCPPAIKNFFKSFIKKNN